MPRRQFVADVEAAQRSTPHPGIFDLKQGEDDGQLEFQFAPSTSNGSILEPVKVTALIPDLSDYPKSHEYMIFSNDDAPVIVAEALQAIRRTNGKTVSELLDIVSATLSRLAADRDGDAPMIDSQFEEDFEEASGDDDEDIYDSDHEAFQVKDTTRTKAQPSPAIRARPSDRAFRIRVRADLITAKSAGFKVGVLGPVLERFNAYVTISIRVSKLGISEEAMQAWRVEPSDFLILILQYPNGYKTNEELQGCDSLRLDSNISMRVCIGKKYKPSLQEAINAFTIVKKNRNNDGVAATDNVLPNAEDQIEESSIKDCFISKPLNEFLRERFVALLRLRSAGMSWTGAEELYSDQSKTVIGAQDAVADKHFLPEEVNDALPDIVNADHYSTRNKLGEFSFPLLAMQFVLRYFVRCTEFCLVCHRKLNSEVEAIKPYVCDSELCLYQYMALGFGPTIEHEILTQPYVVDLLISFCYNSATARKLKEFPDGLSLTVPHSDPKYANTLSSYQDYIGYGQYPQEPTEAKKVDRTEPQIFANIGFDRDRLEIIFFDKDLPCPLRRGQWIVLNLTGTVDFPELHCRVKDVMFFPTIQVDPPIAVRLPVRAMGGQPPPFDPKKKNTPVEPQAISPNPATPAATPKWAPATLQVYGQDFKDLTQPEKCNAICRLLDTLPNVKTMQQYISKQQSADLKNWVERISPSALSMLRWIIASNRACIMQVDDEQNTASGPKKEERLYGMKEFMQFRFAMGAPDKEQRFINEVRQTSNRLSLQYPTIFAWHGSPLYNWHMIIREGLHFKNVDHGRAYGDGVYHAREASTSSGYSSGYRSGMYGNVDGLMPGTWPNSALRISSALALNEIVNAPTEFQSSNPFYVVKQLDWIQTRYLFVRCSGDADTPALGVDKKPPNPLPQDPTRIPRGANNEEIIIPASAIKSSRFIKNGRRPATPPKPSPAKRLKGAGNFNDPIPIEDDDDDTASVLSTASDRDVLYGVDPEPVVESEVVPQKKPKGPTTDFEPGSLDFSKLPLMPTPIYAVSGTTKRLMKELQTVQKIQDSTSLAELGWYIDVEKIDNVYQWIVELHSFHTFEIKGKKLPLAEDMKKKDVKSIVLEIRFNKDFPYTPPYVRVIRPRFLSFTQGGGGHIVLGGAMCMELLTNTGWSSVSSMESVLMQIRMAIASEPFARLDMRGVGADYGTGEAADGYIRACQTHGWQVPPGFKEMAYGGMAM